jgi:hypothetical protein
LISRKLQEASLLANPGQEGHGQIARVFDEVWAACPPWLAMRVVLHRVRKFSPNQGRTTDATTANGACSSIGSRASTEALWHSVLALDLNDG